MSIVNQSIKKGVFYTALSRYSGVFFSIFLGAVLARLLSPEEFGIVALVTVFTSFFNLLGDFGLGPAVVQNQSLTEQEINMLFSFSIFIGVFLAGVFFCLAPLIAHFYRDDSLIDISRLLSVSILFYILQIIPKAVLLRRLLFKHLGLLTLFAQIISGGAAIVFALLGFSYYSIVFQSIISGFLLFVFFVSFGYVLPSLKIRFVAIRKVFRFSVFTFLFNFINYFSRNLDNILVGKFLGSGMLGYYEKSYRLMMMPVQNLTHVITPVLMPVLSKHQNNPEIVYGTYLKVVRILTYIGIPLSVFLYFAAHEVIVLIFGYQWLGSVDVFRILSITVFLQMVNSSCGSVFQAVNRADLLLFSGLISAVFIVSGILYGIFVEKTLSGVGHGLVFGYFVSFIQNFYLLIKVALKKSLISYFRNFITPFIGGCILVLALFLYGKVAFDLLYVDLLFKLLISGSGFLILVYNAKDYRTLVQVFFSRKIGCKRGNHNSEE